MQVPRRHEAEQFLNEAEERNPGVWADHSRNVGRAAERIAARHPRMDPDAAFAMGALHDIGRRDGVSMLRHVMDGYRFMNEQGYPAVARVCLTHSFVVNDIRSYGGKFDCAPADLEFINGFLARTEPDVYDRLIQLCDHLCLPEGFCLLEKRMLQIMLKHGTNPVTSAKWRRVFEIRREFEADMGVSVYEVLPEVVETTFGVELVEPED